MHLLHDGISTWEEPPCNTGVGASTGSAPLLPPWGRAVRTWERSTTVVVALPPCSGDACMFPCRGMLQKAFWHQLLASWTCCSSEFKAELCLHEKGLQGLCSKPAACNKMLMKGWLKPQPRFQTCPLPRPRASQRPWDPKVDRPEAVCCRTLQDLEQSGHTQPAALLEQWSSCSLSNQSFSLAEGAGARFLFAWISGRGCVQCWHL